jgi:organic radical activating enzyme
VFVRFAGCNLRCNYCDTPKSQTLQEPQEYLSAREILQCVKKTAKANNLTGSRNFPLSVSLTGGEPLLYSGFLKQLLPELKKLKAQVYLETNATLPDGFREIEQWVDIVSADIKLPSACNEAFWGEHKAFLGAAGKRAFVKLVLTAATTTEEVERAVRVVRSVSREMPLILQPCTPHGKCGAVDPEQIYIWAALARKNLARVHVLPQMHTIWKVR